MGSEMCIRDRQDATDDAGTGQGTEEEIGEPVLADQALEQLNSAKNINRRNFILKSIENAQAMGKKVTPADEEEFGAMYDRVKSTAQQKTPAAPAAQAPGTPRPANPNILRLITAPGSAQPAQPPR